MESRPSGEAFVSLREDLDAAKLQLEEMQREHEETLSRLAEQREADQREVQLLLDEQRETDRKIAEQRLSEALAEHDVASESSRPELTADSSESPEAADNDDRDEADADTDSIPGMASATMGAMIAPAEQQESPSHAETDIEDSDAGAEYQSESIENQDLVTNVDSEIVNSVSSVQDLVEDSGEDQAEDLDSSNDCDADQQSSSDTQQWRFESEQSAESSGHIAWETEQESDLDPQAELAAQDGEAHWQDESPEVSVNEMIDDIEQNVDQIITSGESSDNAWESVDDSPTEAGAELEQNSWDQAPASWETSDTAGEEAACDDAAILGEQVSSEESQQLDDGDDGQFESDAGQSPEEGFEPSADAVEEESPWTEDPVEKSSYDAWSSSENVDHQVRSDDEQESDSEELSDHALSAMLIRDLEVNDSDEESDDNTQVMNESSEMHADADHECESTSPWDHSSLSSVEDSVDHTELMSTEANVEEASADENAIADDETASESDVEEEAEQITTHGKEDSIEAYMNRLLQRVQGDDVPGSGSGLEMSDTRTVTSPLLDDEELEAVPTAESKSVDENAPLIPRSQAPERDGNLSAMRELANESARTAVSRSVRIQARDTQLKGMMKFVQVAVAVLCAVACYFFLDWGFMLRAIAIIAILVIAGIVAQEGFVLLADAKRRMRSPEHSALAAEESVDGYEPEPATTTVEETHQQVPDEDSDGMLSEAGASTDRFESDPSEEDEEKRFDA